MTQVLTDAEVDAAVVERSLRWQRTSGVLEKVVRCDRFAGALRFVNAVGELAEAADHHPDIDIRWDTVRLHLVTHSAGGITESDLALAAAIDSLGVPGTTRP